MILSAISIRQPWAVSVALGWKPWENRPRRWNHRGPMLIHAGKAYEEDAAEFIESRGHTLPDEIRLGGIIGVANLVDCAPPILDRSGWRFPGQYGLLFESAITLPFRRLKGALGPFKVELTPEEEAIVRPWIDSLSTR